MVEQTPVAVVGGGIIGMSIAWRLVQSGLRVTVFDQGEIGREASWAGAGMLAPGGEAEGGSALATLILESRAMYAGFVRELQSVSHLAIDYQECGALELAYSPEHFAALKLRVAHQFEAGISSKQVNGEQVAAFWPRVRREDLAGAFFYEGDGIVNPREVLAALTVACRIAGVIVQQNSRVDSVSIQGLETLLEIQGRRESFAAVVIAAGAWSSAIPIIGVPAIPPARPIKGHLIGYHQPHQTCNTILRHHHTYVLQRENGLLIVGASVEEVGFRRELDQTVAAGLIAQAGFLLPHLAETTPTEIWTGFRPGSDGVQLGSWSSPRLYLAYGHYRNGILLAPLTAKMIAAELMTSLQKL